VKGRSILLKRLNTHFDRSRCSFDGLGAFFKSSSLALFALETLARRLRQPLEAPDAADLSSAIEGLSRLPASERAFNPFAPQNVDSPHLNGVLA